MHDSGSQDGSLRDSHMSDENADAARGDAAVVWPADPPPNTSVLVATKDELFTALAAATPGTVIDIDPSATIDLTGEKGIVVPAYVTLRGGGGVRGKGGAHLFTNEHDTTPLFATGGPGVRFTGLRIQGSDTEVGPSAYYRPTARGISTIRGDNLRVDHCELWGWSHAAVYADYSRRVYYHHNYVHDNRRNGLGYGIVLVRESDALIERNRFNDNRHAIAGTGRPNVSYEARYNMTGPTRTSHAFDMHGEDEVADNGSPYAGHLIEIHHNTFTGSANAVVIRGRPKVGAYVNDNCFAQSEGSGTAIIQTRFTGNLYKARNRYSQPAGDCHNVAAPTGGVRGDVNGDGYADLVTLFQQSAHVKLGSKEGALVQMPPTFEHSMDSALEDGEGHVIIDVADVNGDLHADLITGFGDGNAYVYPGNALSHFGTGVTSFKGTYPTRPSDGSSFDPIAVADVNGDGRADLVSHRGGDVIVHPGQANATFGTAVSSFNGTFVYWRSGGEGHLPVDVADVNGDGRADLVTLHSNGNAYVYPGTASGAFGSAVSSFNGTGHGAHLDGEGFVPVSVADVTGDGRADLVMTHTNGTVYVYPGQASGALGSRAESFAGTLDLSLFDGDGHEVVAALDMTGDGHADLVTMHSSGTVHVYPGQAAGTFASAVQAFDGLPSSHASVRDTHEPLAAKPYFRRAVCDPSGC